MRLVKREKGCAICTSTMWFIPTMSYILCKVNGMEYHREWIWWMVIPVMVLIWVLINWKIKK